MLKVKKQTECSIGLNPHASEMVYLEQEINEIIPAVEFLKKKG